MIRVCAEIWISSSKSFKTQSTVGVAFTPWQFRDTGFYFRRAQSSSQLSCWNVPQGHRDFPLSPMISRAHPLSWLFVLFPLSIISWQIMHARIRGSKQPLWLGSIFSRGLLWKGSESCLFWFKVHMDFFTIISQKSEPKAGVCLVSLLSLSYQDRICQHKTLLRMIPNHVAQVIKHAH